jgi:hypothetical protein
MWAVSVVGVVQRCWQASHIYMVSLQALLLLSVMPLEEGISVSVEMLLERSTQST